MYGMVGMYVYVLCTHVRMYVASVYKCACTHVRYLLMYNCYVGMAVCYNMLC